MKDEFFACDREERVQLLQRANKFSVDNSSSIRNVVDYIPPSAEFADNLAFRLAVCFQQISKSSIPLIQVLL